ncbi:MAG: hypothetical protein QXL94_00855 [Candidatus Parvarchaeum sp.]
MSVPSNEIQSMLSGMQQGKQQAPAFAGMIPSASNAGGSPPVKDFADELFLKVIQLADILGKTLERNGSSSDAAKVLKCAMMLGELRLNRQQKFNDMNNELGISGGGMQGNGMPPVHAMGVDNAQ